MSRSRQQARKTYKSTPKIRNSDKSWAYSIEQAAAIPATHSHFLNELVKRESQRPLSTQDQIALTLAFSMLFIPTASAMLKPKTATNLSIKSASSSQQRNEPIVPELIKPAEPKSEDRKKTPKKPSQQSAKMARMKDVKALDEYIKQKEKESNFSEVLHSVDEIPLKRIKYHRQRINIIKDELKSGAITLDAAKNKICNAIAINIPATYFGLIDTIQPHALPLAEKQIYDAFMATEYKDIVREMSRIENLAHETIKFEAYDIILKLFKFHYEIIKNLDPKEGILTLETLKKYLIDYLDKLFEVDISKLKLDISTNDNDGENVEISEIDIELESVCFNKIDELVKKHKEEYLQWFEDKSLSKINSADILAHYDKILPEIKSEIKRFVLAKENLAINMHKLSLEIRDAALSNVGKFDIAQDVYMNAMEKFVETSKSIEEKFNHGEIGLTDTIIQMEVAKDLVVLRHTYYTLIEYLKTVFEVFSLENTVKKELIIENRLKFENLQVKIEKEFNNFDRRLHDSSLEKEKILSAIENFKEFTLILRKIGAPINKQTKYLENILKGYYTKWMQPKLEETISSVRKILNKIISAKNYSAEIEKMVLTVFERDVSTFRKTLNESTEVIFQNLDKLTLVNIEKSFKNIIRNFLTNLKQRMNSNNFLDDILREHQIERDFQQAEFIDEIYILFNDHYYLAMSTSIMTFIATIALVQWTNIQKFLMKRQPAPSNINKAKREKSKGSQPRKIVASKPRNHKRFVSLQAVTRSMIQLKINTLSAYLIKFQERLEKIEKLRNQTLELEQQKTHLNLDDKTRNKIAKDFESLTKIKVGRLDFLKDSLTDCEKAQDALKKVIAKLATLTNDAHHTLTAYDDEVQALDKKYGSEYLSSEKKHDLAVYEKELGDLHDRLQELVSSKSTTSPTVKANKGSTSPTTSSEVIKKRLAKKSKPVTTILSVNAAEMPTTSQAAPPKMEHDDRIGGTLLKNKSLILFQAGPSTSTANPIENPLHVRREGKSLSRRDAIIFHIGKLQRLMNKSAHEAFHHQAIMLHLTKICNIALKINEFNEQKLSQEQLKSLKDLRLALVHPAIFSFSEETKLQLFKSITRNLLTWHIDAKQLPETLAIAITSNIKEPDVLKDLIAQAPMENIIEPREINLCEFVEEEGLQNNLHYYTATILEYNDKLSDESVHDADKVDYCSAILNLNMHFNETVKQLSRFSKFSELRTEKIHTSQVTTLRNVAAHETREYDIEEIKKFVRVNFCDYLSELALKGIKVRQSPQTQRHGL